MMATVHRYFIAECPLKDACTTVSWSRQKKCQSFVSVDDAKANLKHHLQKSGHHWMNTVEYIDEVVAATEVLHEELPAHVFDVCKPSQRTPEPVEDAPTPPPPKRPRTAEVELEATMKSRPASPPRRPPPPPLPCASLASASSSSIPPRVPRRDITMILGSIERARLAADHAARLANGAELAFAAEAAKLAELYTHIEWYLMG
jgi:hypothetical protein